MKNFILIISILIIIPLSGKDSENKGCSSRKTDTSEYKSKDKEENSEFKEDQKVKRSSAGTSSEIFYNPNISAQ